MGSVEVESSLLCDGFYFSRRYCKSPACSLSIPCSFSHLPGHPRFLPKFTRADHSVASETLEDIPLFNALEFLPVVIKVFQARPNPPILKE